MTLGIEEQRNLRDLAIMFYPESRGKIAGAVPDEHTLELMETMLIEITKCTKTSQRFIEDLAGNRMIKGFLRKSLNRMLHELKGKDAKFVGNIGCTNTTRNSYKSMILESMGAY
jgi:hypothetical protein